jgi:hypothetical protein
MGIVSIWWKTRPGLEDCQQVRVHRAGLTRYSGVPKDLRQEWHDDLEVEHEPVDDLHSWCKAPDWEIITLVDVRLENH